MKSTLYANLNAEQARKGLTDAETAKTIGIETRTYIAKKKSGAFKVNEINKLCKLFSTTYEYLFEVKEA